MPTRLSLLVEGLAGAEYSFRDVEVRGVTCDSRQVQPGYVFVAVEGTKVDGAKYVEDAIRRGAVAVISEKAPVGKADVAFVVVKDARGALAEASARFHGSPTQRMNVIGITGTKGKTTTSYLVRSIFSSAGEKVGLLGTIDYVLGTRVIPSPLTTPSADELQKYFAEMVEVGCRSAVMEVSSIALDQQRTRGVRFAAGIFTNLTRDHLDYHKTAAKYRAAKSKLFESLSPKGLAIINADDPAAAFMKEHAKGRVITYGLQNAADVTAAVEASGAAGMRMRLKLGAEELGVSSRLIGRHNAYNILAAAATTWAMGYDFEIIRAGIEAMAAVPGRLEPVDAGQDFSVLVDYAHTEDSIRNVVSCVRPLAEQAGGRVIVVFGCGGDRDRGKRPKMGKAAEELSDFFILTSDNPRTEDPMAIIKEIETGLANHSKYLIEADRYAAIKIAIGMARRGDVVLIAGKGHETYQICGTQTRPFDDRRVAREVIAGRINAAH